MGDAGAVKYPGRASVGAVEPNGQYTDALPQGAGMVVPPAEEPAGVQAHMVEWGETAPYNRAVTGSMVTLWLAVSESGPDISIGSSYAYMAQPVTSK